MTRRAITTTWISAFMALFLVTVLPYCFFEARARAQVAGSTNGPSNGNSNNNEEREEREDRDEGHVVQVGSRPPPVTPEPPRIQVSTVAVAAPRTSAISRSVAPQLHPSQFSVRRLI